MAKVIRSVKNVTKGYSSVQVKVRNATSNDPWGPTGTEMSEIARVTFNSSTDFFEVMDMLDKRLNDKGKNWRHVLKALKVLDYCLHEGSDLVGTWARKNIYIIKTLREFQYTDDDGKDVGQNVRVSAKELTTLIMDEERLRTERRDRKNWKSRVTGIEDYGGGDSFESPNNTPSRKKPVRKRNADEDDAEYKLALEASKYEAEQDKERRARAASSTDPEDEDLAKAIRLSEEEAELRRKKLEESNTSSLFDDSTPVTSQQPQFTGYNQGYQQQSAVDWFGNPIDQTMQQPQATGYLNSAYAQQPTGQPSNGMNGAQGQLQPQQGVYDQYHQFMQQQQQQQLVPQQTAFHDPSGLFGSPSVPAAQSALGLPPGSNNPWAQQNQQADALRPLPTGSNNPFAQNAPKPAQTQQQPFGQPSLSMLQQQQTATQPTFGQQPSSPFSAIPSSSPFASQTQPQAPIAPSFPDVQKEQNPHHARLNALLAAGDGQDTFGNTGDLRIPAQHTAPGTFVNSAAHGLNKLNMQQTGNNPFLHQQFTGAPQSQQRASNFGSGGYGAGQSAGFGGGNNPFGQQQQQHPRHPAHSTSLIDL